MSAICQSFGPFLELRKFREKILFILIQQSTRRELKHEMLKPRRTELRRPQTKNQWLESKGSSRELEWAQLIAGSPGPNQQSFNYYLSKVLKPNLITAVP